MFRVLESTAGEVLTMPADSSRQNMYLDRFFLFELMRAGRASLRYPVLDVPYSSSSR
jgi:hypothetical protein